MKKLLFTLLAAITIISCSKDEENRPDDASINGKIQYKLNGQLYVYENIDPLTEYAIIFKQLPGPLSYTRYMVNAVKGANAVMGCELITDSLSAGQQLVIDSSHNPNSSTTIKHGAQQSSIYFNGDILTVNITSHSNGRVTGTFSGKMSPLYPSLDYNTRSTTVITEGVFDNVKVSY